MIMAISNVLKSKIILAISALAILTAALAFTSILTHNKYDNYNKLVIYIDNKPYESIGFRARAITQESFYLTYAYAKFKCIVFNMSMFNITNGELCLPYSLITDTSYSPIVIQVFDTLTLPYLSNAEMLIYRIIANIPAIKGIVGNGYLKPAEMQYSGGPVLYSIVNSTYAGLKYVYKVSNLTYDLNYVAYGRNGTLLGLVKVILTVGNNAVALDIVFTPRSELILSVPFKVGVNYSLTTLITVNNATYVNYTYSISNPVIEYSEAFSSVTWGCYYVDLPMLNISYSNLCLPLGMSISMPSYFWFSNGPMSILMPHIREATGLILKVLHALPAVRQYINGNALVMNTEGFQVSWVREGGSTATYISVGAIYYDWVFSVYKGGARIGLIYVAMHTAKNGPTHYVVDIDVKLIPRDEVYRFNSIKLQGLVAVNETNSTWSGYVVSYDSGYSQYGNDTFEALSSWITLPELSLNSMCVGNQALAAWIGLSPGSRWDTPYVQAGWMWEEQVSQEYPSYLLFYADEPQGDLITPVSVNGYYVEPYLTVTVNMQYGYATSSSQAWYINWYIGYPNGTYVEVSYNNTYPFKVTPEADNWQSAQFIVEAPLINGEYACLPSINGGGLVFYSDYIYDTVNPTIQLASNGTWIGLSQFISRELQGTVYLYNVTLSNVGGYAQPTGIGKCTVPPGYYDEGYVSSNCFQVKFNT